MPMTKLKLFSKFTDEKIDLPSYYTYVFESKVIFADGKSEYKFLTNSRTDADIAKTPLDMFDEQFIDNDLQKVIETLDENE